jgi:hypothetical protein
MNKNVTIIIIINKIVIISIINLNEYSGNVEPEQLSLFRSAKWAVHNKQAKVLGQVPTKIWHLHHINCNMSKEWISQWHNIFSTQ